MLLTEESQPLQQLMGPQAAEGCSGSPERLLLQTTRLKLSSPESKQEADLDSGACPFRSSSGASSGISGPPVAHY